MNPTSSRWFQSAPPFSGPSLGRAQVVAKVVVREDLLGELNVAAVPHLLVEPPHQRLVVGNAHRDDRNLLPRAE
jgi:hypothetical protein